MQKSILIGPSSFGEINNNAISKIENAGYNVIKNPFGRKIKKEELIKLLTKDVIGLIAGLETIDSDIIECSELESISRLGAGISNIDIQALEKKNIKLKYIPDGPTQSVVELSVSNVINLSRKTFLMDNELKYNKKWHRVYGNEIYNKNILIIGYGNIGRKVARILNYIGSNILVYDPFIKEENSNDVNFCELHEGLSKADIISIHASGEKCIIGKKEFEVMKKGVLICNSARGQAIDEFELINALNNKMVESIWMDTFTEEPYQGELLKFNQCIFTPHISSLTVECRLKMEEIAVNNLLNDLDGL